MSLLEFNLFKKPVARNRQEFDESRVAGALDSGSGNMHWLEHLQKQFEQKYKEISYKDGRREIKVDRGDLVIRLEYEDCDSPSLSLNRAIAEASSEHFLLLSALTIENKKTKEVLDIKSLLPENCKIFFSTGSGRIDGCNFEPESNSILISGDISRPNLIFTLLHEIGHSLDFKDADLGEQEKFGQGHLQLFRYIISEDKITDQQNEREKKIMKERQTDLLAGLSADDLQKALDSEKGAWVFALRKMWPFLEIDDVLTEKNALDYAKECYATYSLDAKRVMAEILPEVLAEIKRAEIQSYRDEGRAEEELWDGTPEPKKDTLWD